MGIPYIISLILIIPVLWISGSGVFVHFTCTPGAILLAGFFFLVVFLCVRYWVGVTNFMIYSVIPWTYGVYTNDEFGFSTSIPLEFTNMPHVHPPDPGLVIHARDKSGYAAITIFAGTHYYGNNPSIADIERLEKRAVEKDHGRLESMERISIDHADAVKTISEIQSVTTKKIALVRDGVEYLFICSAPGEHFSVFDPAFEKLFSTLSWIPKK
jgi:hypothetical protein